MIGAIGLAISLVSDALLVLRLVGAALGLALDGGDRE